MRTIRGETLTDSSFEIIYLLKINFKIQMMYKRGSQKGIISAIGSQLGFREEYV